MTVSSTAQARKQAAEEERRARMTALELEADDCKRHVAEQILTLKCPRCAQGIYDFNDCFALTCSRCAVRDSNSGHQLLLPPANCCPIFAFRTSQGHLPGWDLRMVPRRLRGRRPPARRQLPARAARPAGQPSLRGSGPVPPGPPRPAGGRAAAVRKTRIPL